MKFEDHLILELNEKLVFDCIIDSTTENLPFCLYLVIIAVSNR